MLKIKMPSNLPDVDNLFLYCYRSICKILAIFIFVIGTLVVGSSVFPLILLFSKNRNDFRVKARRYTSNVFRYFIFILKMTRTLRIRIHELERLKNIRGKVIVANHPSLLDVVCLTAFVPNANCIVRASLTKIISQIYIKNNEKYHDLLQACKQDLESGNNILIFPEGTRTPRFKRNIYQKGAARIAIYAKCDILPVFIGGCDKYGLGKHDPLFSFNPVERYFYDFILLPEIKCSDYDGMSLQASAKCVTDKIEEEILAADAEYRKTNTECRTFNNV